MAQVKLSAHTSSVKLYSIAVSDARPKGPGLVRAEAAGIQEHLEQHAAVPLTIVSLLQNCAFALAILTI